MAHLVRYCRLCRSSLFKSLLRYAWSDCSLQEHFVRSVEAFPLAELQAKDHEQKMQGGLHPKGVTCWNKQQGAFHAAPKQPLDKAIRWLLSPGTKAAALERRPRPCSLSSPGRDGAVCSWAGKGQVGLPWSNLDGARQLVPLLSSCAVALFLVCHPLHLHISKCFIAWVLWVCTRCSTGNPMGRADPVIPCWHGHIVWGTCRGGQGWWVMGRWVMGCFPFLSCPGPGGNQGEPQKECSGPALGSWNLRQPGGGWITTQQHESSNQACWNQKKKRKEEKKQTNKHRKHHESSSILVRYLLNTRLTQWCP